MALNKQQRERLPSTLERSPKKAQDTYVHTLESAEETHGDGEAAHRIAFSALKHDMCGTSSAQGQAIGFGHHCPYRSYRGGP